MTPSTATRLRLAALVAAPLLAWAAAHAQTPAGLGLEEKGSKQEAIYQSRGEQVPEGYVIGRSLLSYTYTLSSGFGRSVAELGPGERWLDIGAGEGQAVIDYATGRYDAMHFKDRARPEKRARAVALSIEDRRTSRWREAAAGLEEGQISYLFGRRLRHYSHEELGKFRLITDVLGGFSYTEQLSLFMEKTLSILDVKGEFYAVLQDVHSEEGKNRPHYAGSPFLTEIANPDGSRLRVCAWLKRIGCVEVACEFKPNHVPPIEVYRIHKVCEQVTVPPLTPVHFEAGTPPERRFQTMKPKAPAAGQGGVAR